MNTLTRLVVLLAIVACFGCVFYLSLNHQVGAYGVETDFYHFYAPTAKALELGQIQLDDFHPPLYGWLLGLLTLTGIFPGEFEAAVLLSVLCYFAVVLLIWHIAQQGVVKDETVAWFAAALMASNPTLMEHACRANIHVFYLAISLAAIYFSLRRNAWLTGLFAALAIWTRYPWLLAILPLLFLPRKKSGPAWSIAVVAWLALGFLTLVFKGSWLYSLNNLNVASGLYNTDLPGNVGLWSEQHAHEFEHLNLLQILLYHPGMAIKSIVTHMGLDLYKAVMNLMVLPAGLLAIAGMRKKFWGDYRHPLLLWTLAFFGILVMTYWFGQYTLGLIPLLSLAAALQLADLPFPKISRWISPVVLAGITVWACMVLSRVMLTGPIDVKEVSVFLRTLPGKKVVARDPRVFYYSGKNPGELLITSDGSVRVLSDYIFLSNYEMSRNDTLKHLFNETTFEEKCDRLDPRRYPKVELLKVKTQYSN